MRCALLVLDMDHTLTASAHLPATWIDTLTRHGATTDVAWCAYRDGIGRASIETVRTCFPARPDLWDRVLADFRALCREREEYAPLPHADLLLERCRSAGIVLALSTGASQAHAERIIADHGWSDYFAELYGSRDGFGKLEHLAALTAIYGFAPAACATVGDGAMEIMAASAVGWRWRIGVGAANGLDPETHETALRAAGATHIVTDLAEAADIVLDGGSLEVAGRAPDRAFG